MGPTQNFEFYFKRLSLRDRPFNLKGGYGFLFRSKFFFRTTQELEYLFFLSRKARNFFPEFNIRLYDKISESDYLFFPPPKSEYFFRKKNITPPFKLNGRSLIGVFFRFFIKFSACIDQTNFI